MSTKLLQVTGPVVQPKLPTINMTSVYHRPFTIPRIVIIPLALRSGYNVTDEIRPMCDYRYVWKLYIVAF